MNDLLATASLPQLKRYSKMAVDELSALAWSSQNTPAKPDIDVVVERSKPAGRIPSNYAFPPHSITALQFI
jgi:hypothetical protein